MTHPSSSGSPRTTAPPPGGRRPRLLRDGAPDPRPLLRGSLHQWSAVVAAVAAVALVSVADTERARLAVAVYGLGLVTMLAVSAAYHRVWWPTPRKRAWMRRLDRSAIFLTVAGTYTPFGLLVVEGAVATMVLVAVWVGAVGGILLNVVWVGSPRWATPLAYLVVGWGGAIGFPQIYTREGVLVTALIALGGVLYSVGASVYARKRPDPAPEVFGYHELFHALVVAAAAAHYAAVALVVA